MASGTLRNRLHGLVIHHGAEPGMPRECVFAPFVLLRIQVGASRRPAAIGAGGSLASPGSLKAASTVSKGINRMVTDLEEPAFLVEPATGRIVLANALASEHLGYEPGTLEQLAIADLHPFEMAAFEHFAQTVEERGIALSSNLTCRTRDGRFLPADISGTCIRSGGRVFLLAILREPGSPNGAPAHTAGARVESAPDDPPDHNTELLERLATTQFILDHAPEMVLWVTPQGRIQYANETAAQTLGHTRAQLERSFIWDVDADSTPEEFAEQVGEFRAAQRIRTQRTMRMADGTLFPVQLTVQHIVYGGIEYLVSFSRDIREEVAARQRAEQYLQELTRISRRHSLGQMSSALAHEVNQPITSVANWTHAAARLFEQDPPPVDRIRDAVERARDSAGRVMSVLQRVQNYLRHGEPAFEYLGLGSLLMEFRQIMEPDLRQRGVTLSLAVDEGLPPVRADAVLIQQVLINLARNGAEAMEANESSLRELRIRTRVLSDCVEVRVQDQGTGLDAETAKWVFEPFRSNKTDGLGVGLFLCRSIVESHGGHLWVETPCDAHGTIFTMSLPVSKMDL